MTDDLPHLPDLLMRVAEGESLEAALILARVWGGRPLYVPHPEHLREGHPMADALGLERARRVADIIGGGDSQIIPMGVDNRARRVIEGLRRGWSHTRIAAYAGVHVRTVERWAQRLRCRTDDRQRSLFD